MTPKAAVVVATYVVRPTAALVVCSNMLAAGEVSAPELLPAILLGTSLFSVLNEGPRNILPYYLSVYPCDLSMKLFLVRIMAPALIYAAVAVLLARC